MSYQLLQRLAHDAAREVKKTAHTEQNKPYSSVVTGCANRATASALLGNHGTVTKDTARLLVHHFEAHEIEPWLGLPPLIYDVKYTGKVWVPRGSRGGGRSVTNAGLESLEVRYDETHKTLTLKFRTFRVRDIEVQQYLAYVAQCGGGDDGYDDDDDYGV